MERIKTDELPEGFYQALYAVQGYLNKSKLDEQLIHLINMRVSQLNACGFCLDMHAKDALHDGETVQRLVGLPAWRESPFYTPKERAVLALAEFLTRMPPEEDVAPLYENLRQHFSQQETAMIGLAIMQINTWNRLVRLSGREAGTYQVGQKG